MATSYDSADSEPANIFASIGYLGELVEVYYDKSLFDCVIKSYDVDVYMQRLENAKTEIRFEKGSVDWMVGRFDFADHEIGKNTVCFNGYGYDFVETLNIVDIRDIIESIISPLFSILIYLKSVSQTVLISMNIQKLQGYRLLRILLISPKTLSQSYSRIQIFLKKAQPSQPK